MAFSPLASSASSSTSTSSRTAASTEQRHEGGGEAPTSAARAILKRHVEQRQRFDSADYAMARSAALRSTALDELEPEPETAYPQQQVRRIRLQRFDSADWVMDALKTSSAAHETSMSEDASNSTQRAVAKLLLDRHAYATCQFVTTPVDQRRLSAERA